MKNNFKVHIRFLLRITTRICQDEILILPNPPLLKEGIKAVLSSSSNWARYLIAGGRVPISACPIKINCLKVIRNYEDISPCPNQCKLSSEIKDNAKI
jgi:hypothetical protein